jgi:hypothetical protein
MPDALSQTVEEGTAPSSRQLDSHTIARLAVEAARDPRTVRAVLDGRRTTANARAAVEGAAARLGIGLPSYGQGEARVG